MTARVPLTPAEKMRAYRERQRAKREAERAKVPRPVPVPKPNPVPATKKSPAPVSASPVTNQSPETPNHAGDVPVTVTPKVTATVTPSEKAEEVTDPVTGNGNGGGESQDSVPSTCTRARRFSGPPRDILPACSQTQFEIAARRFSTGEHWTEIAKDLKIDWGMFSRRGQMGGNPDLYRACQEANKMATIRRIGERAEKCAFDGKKTVTTTEGAGDDKTVTVKEEVFASPEMAKIALEVAAPEIHGKLASRKDDAPAAGVTNIGQILILLDQRRAEVTGLPEADIAKLLRETAVDPKTPQ